MLRLQLHYNFFKDIGDEFGTNYKFTTILTLCVTNLTFCTQFLILYLRKLALCFTNLVFCAKNSAFYTRFVFNSQFTLPPPHKQCSVKITPCYQEHAKIRYGKKAIALYRHTELDCHTEAKPKYLFLHFASCVLFFIVRTLHFMWFFFATVCTL